MGDKRAVKKKETRVPNVGTKNMKVMKNMVSIGDRENMTEPQ